MTESNIQQKIQRKLELLKWFTIKTHGSQMQQGIPDILASHKVYGIRLIEVKNPAGFSFTPAQVKIFAEMVSHGAPVYVLTSDADSEITKLFGPSNYWKYIDRHKGVW